VLQRENERRRKECCNEKMRGEGRNVATRAGKSRGGSVATRTG
jgi:hypothetical protein